MFASCAFMEEGECGCSIPLDLDHERASLFMLFFFLFFLKIHGSITPIGALDYGEMRTANI